MTKRTKIIGGSVIALVIVVLAVMVSIVRPKTEADIAIPLPFGFDDASSSLVGSITPIGVKNGITVKKVLFPEGTDAEVLSMDSVYLVTVPDDDLVDDMPLDQAFTLSGSALVNYFGYKYSSVTALAEKANKSSSIFTEKFPGQFFVSAKARAEDAQHGNAIATFEANNSITMAATDTLSGALLSRNSLYFLIVNEASGATLTVRTPAMCGDGDIEGAEVCDDGDTNSGDGCSNACAVESGYSCTGEPSICTEDPLLTLTTLPLPAERSSHTGTMVPLVRFTVTTGVKAVSMENLVFTGVNGVPPTGGSDAVYMLAAGNSEGDYNIRDIDLCLGGPDEILCENVPHLLPGAFPPHSTHHFQLYGMFGAAQTGVSLQLDASANTALAYAMTDDGQNSIPLRNMSKNGVCQTAPCEISLTTIPSTNWTIGGEQVSPVCGDTIIDVNNDAEECDDGNLIDSDFCSNQCTFPAPPASCGNGNVEVGETCDDADTSSGDGCSNVCAVESGYSCTGEPSVCTLDPVCGNGDIEAGETCDDSNTAAADGCSATCAVESGFVCSGEPSSCHAVVCGDGQKEGSEACDDTNTTDGDGCSATCTVESGFACTGSAPSTCAGICGDGVIKGSETCDDGDTSSGDGCSATCTVESGFSCTSEPSSCTTTCGDNICAGTEPYQDIQCPGGGGGMCNNPNYCALDCAVCGNFIIESPVEQCDDGNTNGGDGCSSNCQTEQ